MSIRTPTDVTAVGLLQEPARRSLYDWVAAQPEPVGREQAARAVGVTRALATFHLDKLVDAGLLEAAYRRLSGRVGPGAGRPARVYWRADREFSVTVPDRRYTRAAQVFATALERIGGGSVPPELASTARETGAELAKGAGRGAPQTRLRRALASGGYEPVSGDDGVLRLRNCPFDTLAREHRQLVCGTNLALAQGLTDAVGVADLEPLLDPRPGFCCVAFRPSGGSAQAS
ncbi:MAG TPA: helix-turn-helix domain-containing protein [Candidatus Limnocylindrales bacterium]|nr:helix-turn-helix domain-containing protein [Candidatus Limnocylindrales bacterium]